MSKTRIKAVLFDYGGVLTPVGQLGTGLMHIADMVGIEAEKLNRAIYAHYPLKQRSDILEEDFWERIGESLGVRIPTELPEFWRWAELDHHEKAVGELVQELQRQNIQTGILSNVVRPIAGFIRSRGGYQNFNPIILSGEVGFSKPEPEIYQLALDRLRLKPEEILFVDDREENLATAEEFGMETVRADNPAQIARDVRRKVGLESRKKE